MKARITGVSLVVLLAAGALAGQDVGQDTPAARLGPDDPGVKQAQDPDDHPVSLKTFGPNVLDDQRHIWTFPAGLVKGRHLMPTVAVLGVTGGLIAADPTTGRFFRRHEDTFAGLSDHLTEAVGTTGSLAA